MTRNLKLLLLGGLALSLSGWILVQLANRYRPSLSPLRVALEGYTNTPGNRSMALFRVDNPNACRVAFRVFGPQARSEGAGWPVVAPAYGAVAWIGSGTVMRVAVPPPDSTTDWRIMIGYEGANSWWQQLSQNACLLQARLGVPLGLRPAAREEPPPPVCVEIPGHPRPR